MEATDPTACAGYVQFARTRQYRKDRYDWVFAPHTDGDFQIENFSHCSPGNEISKLLRHMFSNFSVNYILPIVCAMMLDCRIVVLSSNPEMLGMTAFGILGLVFPLNWPGTFIPLLPKRLETALEAPFAFIIGVHSTLCKKLLADDFGTYFVVNVDTHDASLVGMDDFPAEMMHEADATGDEIKEMIRAYRPLFPAAEISRKLKEFIIKVLGAIYGTEWNTPRDMYDVFLRMRESCVEEVQAMVSQTQFVDTMFREAMEEQNGEILQALWPECDTESSWQTETLKTSALNTNVRFGLKTVAGKHSLNMVGVSALSTPREQVSDSEWERLMTS
jgi:hypothetical protein